jgi:hypothetical protein
VRNKISKYRQASYPHLENRLNFELKLKVDFIRFGDLMGEQEDLKLLQRIDLEIDNLQSREEKLPERESLEKLEDEFKTLQVELEKSQSSLDRERKLQRKIEGEIELLNSKIKREQNKLYSGKITNPKELGSIQKEISALKEKLDDKETELLEQIEKIDQMLEAHQSLTNRGRELEQEIREVSEMIESSLKEIRERRTELSGEREALLGKISEETLKYYTKLRERNPLAVAVLEGTVCNGCRVEVPAEDIDKMKKSEKLWRCPNCGRILVE